MTNSKGSSGHPPLEPGTADALLDRLSTDDEFRSRFANDPVSALAELGHRIPEGLSPACMSSNELASKEEIAEARELIKEFMTSAAPYSNPHSFEAGKINSTLRRK